MFEEMRASGSKLPDMIDSLIKNGWVTYQHHDNWIKKDGSVKGEFDTHSAFELTKQKQTI